ncbi:MAG TPA: PilZ domain-containing protein [Gemmataceae bacterium]|nr:PilZ domain-containing protein [Gemmataceae bacterium]
MSSRPHRPARSAHPTPAAGAGPHLAKLERVLSEVREKLLRRYIPTPDPGARLLRCEACGRAEPRTAEQLRDLARFGWPECCGKVMTLSGEAPAPSPGRDRRGGARRPARLGVRAELRRGGLGMGPDLGLALSDVSADGLRLRLRGRVRAGEEAEVSLWLLDGRAIRTRGRIMWCRPAGGWSFLAGMRLRRRLTADEVALLAE